MQIRVLIVNFFELTFGIISLMNSFNESAVFLSIDSSVARFGNSSTGQYFRLLDLDGDYLLVGARDAVYNISIKTFTEVHSIKWPSPENVVMECLMKGKTKSQCHNFIRVLAKHANSKILVCGTNAFKPMCRMYEHEKFHGYRLDFEFSGLGIAPYDPDYNSTFLLDGDLLYAATVSDFSGADPLIHRRNVINVNDRGIRTERNDAKFFNGPQFVGIFEDAKYVYIWFREQAVHNEHCGQAIHSRVARICRSDNGGPQLYANEWTSFVKASLNCSIPGNYPFYFGQLEAVTTLPNRVGKDKQVEIVYAVFTSPMAGIRSSAICAFNLTHIADVFQSSSFSRYSDSGPWSPMMEKTPPRFRPGECANDSRLLKENVVASLRANPQLDDSVQNHFRSPVSVYSGADRLIQIAVDSQVLALDGHHYDVIYVGTDSGNILKMVTLADSFRRETESSHHIYTLETMNESIQNLMMYDPKSLYNNDRYLIVVTDNGVWRVPLAYCTRFNSCDRCIALQDPHCAWDPGLEQCTFVDEHTGHCLQDIAEGRGDNICHIKVALKSVRMLEDETNPVIKADGKCVCDETKLSSLCLYGKTSASKISTESSRSAHDPWSDRNSVLLLCTGIAILALMLGFLAGSIYSCWRLPLKDHSSMCSSLRQAPRPVYDGSDKFQYSANFPLSNVINAHDESQKFVERNFCLQEPISLKVEELGIPSDKTVLGISTLPRNYRVKQIYL